MRVALLLALFAASASLLSAADQAPRPPQAPLLADSVVARPPQAPAVNCSEYACPANGGRGCSCGADCICENTSPSKRLTYADARPRAVREALPLVVWVGTSCPSCERQLADCLHVHVKTFPGVTGPGVVVGVPRDGELWRTDLRGQPSVEQIRQVIRGAVGAASAEFGKPWLASPTAPVYQPTLRASPPFSTFAVGGFGGAAACRT